MKNIYLELIKKPTQYAHRMTRLRNRIFGEVVRDTSKTSMTVVKMFSKPPLYKDDNIVNYYPRHIETHKLMQKLESYGLYRDEHQAIVDEFRRLRTLRGKGDVVWLEKHKDKRKSAAKDDKSSD